MNYLDLVKMLREENLKNQRIEAHRQRLKDAVLLEYTKQVEALGKSNQKKIDELQQVAHEKMAQIDQDNPVHTNARQLLENSKYIQIFRSDLEEILKQRTGENWISRKHFDTQIGAEILSFENGKGKKLTILKYYEQNESQRFKNCLYLRDLATEEIDLDYYNFFSILQCPTTMNGKPAYVNPILGGVYVISPQLEAYLHEHLRMTPIKPREMNYYDLILMLREERVKNEEIFERREEFKKTVRGERTQKSQDMFATEHNFYAQSTKIKKLHEESMVELDKIDKENPYMHKAHDILANSEYLEIYAVDIARSLSERTGKKWRVGSSLVFDKDFDVTIDVIPNFCIDFECDDAIDPSMRIERIYGDCVPKLRFGERFKYLMSEAEKDFRSVNFFTLLQFPTEVNGKQYFVNPLQKEAFFIPEKIREVLFSELKSTKLKPKEKIVHTTIKEPK